jgi:hypothetical protein
MSPQTIRTEFWEAQLPAGWVQSEREPKEVVYFESPDGTAGVYLSTWRIAGQPLIAAMRDTQAIEERNLPPTERGRWEVLKSDQLGGSDIEAATEYLNRTDRYRIVSRMLGRGDFYVRLTYHDYDCVDPSESAQRSEPVLASLTLRSGRMQ